MDGAGGRKYGGEAFLLLFPTLVEVQTLEALEKFVQFAWLGTPEQVAAISTKKIEVLNAAVAAAKAPGKGGGKGAGKIAKGAAVGKAGAKAAAKAAAS